MRTSTLSALLASALAVSATACKTNSPAPPPPVCDKGQPGASCAVGGDCCSGSCFVPSGSTAGTCVTSPCGDVGASCGAASDCCQATCDPQTHGCIPWGSCALGQPGDSCAIPEDCCSGYCEGALGAKVCTTGPICHNAGAACTGTTAADKAASCCTGYCNASDVCEKPPTKTCLYPEEACSADTQCCSKLCNAGKCAYDMCAHEGDACGSDAQCCGLLCTNAGAAGATCSAGLCLQVGEPCSTANDLCCSGTCSGSRCVPPPPGPTGQTCATLHEACAYPIDCCSGNCQGASGGLKNGTCLPVATCNAFGDVCYRPEDCCSGLCAASAGQAGRCDDAPGGCGQDGYPCLKDEDCCTRKCVDLGAGAKACQLAPGCRMNGDYCDMTAACCNLNSTTAESQWVTCDPVEHLCENGGACNPPGDICGYKASQNCCHEGGGSGSAVCRPDSNGIMRCFGGYVDPPTCVDTPDHHCCYGGTDGSDPDCCLAADRECQFEDQCCDGAPCTMADDGVFRCVPPRCLPSGAVCSTAPPPPSGYTAVAGDCCAPDLCYYVGVEAGWRCAATQPPPACVLPGNACTPGGDPCCSGEACSDGACPACRGEGATCASAAECCSGSCDAGVCRLCVDQGGSCSGPSDCCTGLGCDKAPGATQGTCGSGPRCASTDQPCTTMGCCLPTDTCTDGVCRNTACHETAQVCTSGGGECCQGLQCYALDAFESRVPCDPASASCFCDVPGCVGNGEPCSTLVPCCTGLCSDDVSGTTCTSSDTTQCSCSQAG